MNEPVKIRCSSLGKIMSCLPTPLSEAQEKTFAAYDERFRGIGKELTQRQLIAYVDLLKRRGEKAKMSKGAKTFADQLAFDIYYNRREKISSKYLDKGNAVEEQSTTLVSRLRGEFLTTKSQRKSNDWITGHCDIETKDSIIDIKSSWDFKTFPLLDDKPKTSLYEWQIRGYMWLYDKPVGIVAYCLSNTPFRMIDDELKRIDWRENIFTQDGTVRDNKIHRVVEVVSNHLFDEKAIKEYCHQSTDVKKDWFSGFKPIPLPQRVKFYEFKRTKETETQIRQCVELVQRYIQNKINGFSTTI